MVTALIYVTVYRHWNYAAHPDLIHPHLIEWTFFREHTGDRAIGPMAPSHFQPIQPFQPKFLQRRQPMRLNPLPTLHHLSKSLMSLVLTLVSAPLTPNSPARSD
jgi:hypothetical protein